MSKRHLIIDTRIAPPFLSRLDLSCSVSFFLSHSLSVSFFSSSMPSGGKATLHGVAAKSSSVFLFQFCKMQFRYLVCCIASSSTPFPPGTLSIHFHLIAPPSVSAIIVRLSGRRCCCCCCCGFSSCLARFKR